MTSPRLVCVDNFIVWKGWDASSFGAGRSAQNETATAATATTAMPTIQASRVLGFAGTDPDAPTIVLPDEPDAESVSHSSTISRSSSATSFID